MKKYEYLYKRNASKFGTIPSITSMYLEEVMLDRGRKRGGYDAIEGRLNNLGDFFLGQISIISEDDIEQYKFHRFKTVSNGTVRLELQLLSRLFKWCLRKKIINAIPVPNIEYPKAGKPRDKVINEFSFKLILSNSTDIMKPIFILGYETAMRRNEILAIRPSIVDLKKRVIRLDATLTKNEIARDVPLSTIATNLLSQLLEDRKDNYLLFNVQPKSVTRAFKRACNLSHIDNVCFHSLRHTCITRYAEREFNILALQCISGHKDIRMLARYSHIRAEKVALMMD